jgi:cytochrome P450
MTAPLTFPLPPRIRGGAHREYARRRAEAPLDPVLIHASALAVLAVRYADVARVLTDPAFSRDLRRPGDAKKFPGLDVTGGGQALTGMDPPAHTRLRRLVQPVVGRAKTERWRPVIRSIAEDLADRVVRRGPPADLVAAFTRVFPAMVMARLLGVPEPDHERFQQWTRGFLSVTEESKRERILATRRLLGYVCGLIEQARNSAGVGMLSALVAAQDEGDALSDSELRNLAFALLVGGYETTSATLGRGLLALLREPAAYQALIGDPALVPTAVEEILRFEPPDDGGMLRRSVCPVQLPSGQLEAGTIVLPSMCAANRDPAAFDDPDRFDITRSPNPHLTFGAGPHYCLGANIARIQLQEALYALLGRLPDLRLADGDGAGDLPYTEGLMVKTLDRLPVSWGAAVRRTEVSMPDV